MSATQKARAAYKQVWSDEGLGNAVLIAFGLGSALGFGIGSTFFSENWVDFGLFIAFMSVFHLWEFLYVALYHPEDLSINSFLLNHSTAYTLANVATLVEYFLERMIFGFKGNSLFLFIGFVVALSGQIIRTVAMVTAGSNFSHLIAEKKEDDHKLVTFGIYSYLRHPSYFGWFYWSIALQILLMNPIMLAGAAYASWTFFKERIAYEEVTLIKHFGDDYKRYRSVTPVGIPLIP